MFLTSKIFTGTIMAWIFNRFGNPTLLSNIFMTLLNTKRNLVTRSSDHPRSLAYVGLPYLHRQITNTSYHIVWLSEFSFLSLVFSDSLLVRGSSISQNRAMVFLYPTQIFQITYQLTPHISTLKEAPRMICLAAIKLF